MSILNYIFKQSKKLEVNKNPVHASEVENNIETNESLEIRCTSNKKPRTEKYPRNKSGRSFQDEWIRKFKWLEYSDELDRTFCRICQIYQPKGTKETTFTTTGFCNWKHALDKKKGFPAHEISRNHLTAIAKCEERKMREEQNQSVSTLVNDKVLDDNRYYVTSIMDMIRFLSTSQLPFRGTYDLLESCEDGVFMKLFQYTLKKDRKLSEITKRIPKNASYLSPKMQNEIIQLIANMVRYDIAQKVLNADIPWYTLFMDGSRNKKMEEVVAFGVRFITNGKVLEKTLSVEIAKQCDANFLAQMALDLLDKCKLDSKYLLSQCYDGASVMSGEKGGVQGILQNRLKRKIPYVHCYNHRLHLVVMKTVMIDEIQHFFSQCNALYNFLKKSHVRNVYEGKNFTRLLEQRWSGHFDVVKILCDNFGEVVEALQSVKMNENKKFSGEDVAVSFGLLHTITTETFCFCLALMRKLLNILHPADKILQSRSTSLEASNRVINSVDESLNDIRNEDGFRSTLDNSRLFIEKLEHEMKKQRARKSNSKFRDYIVYDFINEVSDESGEETKFRSLYFETIDSVRQEIEKRFCNNQDLIIAITAAEELNEDIENYKYLNELGVINIPEKEEIIVAKNFLKSSSNTEDSLEKLYQVRQAFPNVYNLLATCRVFGCSTAICESTFSSLTQLDRPQRQAMTSERQANLVLLHFEKDITNSIDSLKLLQKFNTLVDRKLQLF